ncbi:hypothetical protein NFHSH190041_22030 [Shewanella sp. NFH-SH190041]|nr:hypothetical protein NFHSH190041_22030 [Shewanella sp. NFH-SH190041]
MYSNNAQSRKHLHEIFAIKVQQTSLIALFVGGAVKARIRNIYADALDTSINVGV